MLRIRGRLRLFFIFFLIRRHFNCPSLILRTFVLLFVYAITLRRLFNRTMTRRLFLGKIGEKADKYYLCNIFPECIRHISRIAAYPGVAFSVLLPRVYHHRAYYSRNPAEEREDQDNQETAAGLVYDGKGMKKLLPMETLSCPRISPELPATCLQGLR